ncbi:MAG: NAD-dependent epimerase/dehydratase family protein [Nitrososphaerales archaeon]
MSVLVVGSGLIGTQIAKLFLDAGDDTAVYDISPQLGAMSEVIDVSKIKVIRGDLLDLPYLVSTVKENHVDTIIHTVAVFPGALTRNMYNGIRINTDGTLNVLEAARLLDIKRVIFSSSLAVYWRDTPEASFDEETTPTKPVTLYGATKLMGEYAGANYSKTYGLDFRVARFANVIGPWRGDIQTHNGIFINELLDAAVNGKQLHIENPYPLILDADWIYSKDLARGVFLLSRKSDLRSKTFNLGMGKMSKVEEILESIREIIPGAKLTLGEATPLPTRPMKIQRSKEELQWEPKYDIRSMMREMVDWYRARGSTV